MQKCEKIIKKHAKIVPKREQNRQQNAGKKNKNTPKVPKNVHKKLLKKRQK